MNIVILRGLKIGLRVGKQPSRGVVLAEKLPIKDLIITEQNLGGR